MKQQPRILIVDDNQMMVKTLQDILNLEGYHTETAYSGAEALEKVANNPFDCVLSDVKMPEVSGVELYRVIKSRQPDLPVVLMTAYAPDNLTDEEEVEGIIAVLSKPLDIDLLLKFLSSLS